jgi:multidrug efflux pump subunit AcrA (membrane-fusion protein)
VRLGRITAPISGNVVTANVRERVGQSVATGDLIAVIHDASPPQVEVFTEEPDAAQVEEGMHVHVRLWGSQGRLLTGRVRKVNRATEEYAAFHIERIRSDREELAKASADREPNRRLRICVDLDPPAEPVVPGMTGYARIVLEDGLFWQALARPVLRFFRVEVWSWLP